MTVVHEISTEALILCDSREPVAAATVRTRDKTFETPELREDEELPAARYILAEFPTECWSFPHFATTVAGLLDEFFVKKLPADARVEHVYWDSEEDVLKVWTVTSESDFMLEEPIYQAQMFFMEQFPTFGCDFSVIYRYGKALEDIAPQGAHLLR